MADARAGASDRVLVGTRAGLLASLLLCCMWLATRALRVYQRAV